MLQSHIPLIVCSLVCLLNSTEAPAKSFNAESTAPMDSAQHQGGSRNVAVTEWFRRYDQIRRNAEMTMGDKLQSRRLAAKEPEKNNAALASRMIKKYTTALSELKELRSIPETKELQAGYIEYFSRARQLFIRYLDAQKETPFTNQPMMPTRRELQELDRTNKKLDDELRGKFNIPKHKHG